MKNETGYEGLVRQNPDGLQAVSFLVGGAHCAACIQKIESALLGDPHIKHARLNFSTGRLGAEWDGPPALANDFAQKIEALGYTVHPYNLDTRQSAAEDENTDLLLRLGVAGFAMGNIMLLSVGLWTTDAVTMGVATRELLHWVSALIAIPAIVFSGKPFFNSAWAALKNRNTNMDVPISVAMILASAMSVFEILNHGEHAYFDSAVMLMFFLLIGRYLDFRVRRNAKSAASDLMQTLSGFATVLKNGKTRRIFIRDLGAGMEVLVAAGETIPADGTITKGQGTVDISLVTGETLPASVKKGDRVYAGTLNLSTPLQIKVTKAGEGSLLADVVRLIESAEQAQAQYIRLADKAARLYTPVVHLFALLAFALWWGLWGAAWQDALMTAITVLIITCPCALGLAVPVVQVLASGILMKRGVLVKSGDALERLARIDTILFDKTGTLTLGKPSLTGNYNQADLRLAASLAAHSRHPLSIALRKGFDGDLLSLTDIQEHAGKGLKANFEGREIKLGNATWCGIEDDGIEGIRVFLTVDEAATAAFHFEDKLRGDAKTTIAGLQNRGLDTILLSGDRKAAAENIATEAGIKTLYAEQTPVDKYNVLQELKSQGHKVLMVGDGLNDAPVLASADISIAPGTAIDMARNAADIVFMGEALAPVALTYHIAVKAQKLVKLNFALAVLYNAVAIPLAFAGLVTPLIAAIAMAGSSLIVIANSFRLKSNL